MAVPDIQATARAIQRIPTAIAGETCPFKIRSAGHDAGRSNNAIPGRVALGGQA